MCADGSVADPRVALLAVVDSTNAEALRRARAGDPGPLWIVAERQTAGRGRRGRSWISPPGNLHATLLITDPSPAAVAPQLAFVAALALHDAAVAAAPAIAGRLKLKWPNDMLCGGRKIAGILIEGEGAPVTAAIGIGVNCRHHPAATDYPATDFATEDVAVAPAALAAHLRAAMARRLAQWDRGDGFAAIRADWLGRAEGLGTAVVVRLAGREIDGVVETIDASGRLLLRRPDGSREAISAGEVFPLRPTSAQSGPGAETA